MNEEGADSAHRCTEVGDFRCHIRGYEDIFAIDIPERNEIHHKLLSCPGTAGSRGMDL